MQQQVDVTTADGTADAYLVTPDGGGSFRPVLLFMDAFGLRPQIMEMASRIAERGYAVLAPNLFYRSRRSPLVELDELVDEQKRGAAFGRLMPMMRELTAERVIADARAYLDFLAARPDVAAGPGGIVGYCMGGRNALIAASALPDRFAALASFHAGRVVTETPDSPHRAVGALTAEVYFGHADNDGSMTPEHVAALEAALTEAGVKHTSELYEGAPHGFTMADTAMHDAAAEQRHWQALFTLLDRALPA
ncbi:putative dienelactone hydrolase [Actinoplanes missouriensis 431]|uniref:Putative dienelactone hydrolase n=1 Tax=Actinoplanes missouriensis (strain ATCC 14538 / DSM 43046 / CBS 188.64 / JCM 3121 / NBRC 102363 / NCIMB 12654 / NRRL B-3342 / UNCC 431) TaxID=512565 RepID=I0HJB2_ACTM4|nr:dienelactone hydrolase family protein [Actinoplanes missouriensis]BAL93099.1 putative dienelactone hydrolase [Actinoplanes missouriensis 431]